MGQLGYSAGANVVVNINSGCGTCCSNGSTTTGVDLSSIPVHPGIDAAKAAGLGIGDWFIEAVANADGETPGVLVQIQS